ncbi:Right handed beta helix region [Neorhodopirellula lusitana]|uniref:Right handed beta helix region n=1 Tax=Neorhodopirellula lusitana TaxID=445327 RepID=A0ABY1PT88_9BACT|nr:right-handed parallel beta-helix repeat-containing protein [Neorhodopirellula lusitana]SMP46680.1 Right handed beta helix region [Neorhodopirellula lusitana]
MPSYPTSVSVHVAKAAFFTCLLVSFSLASLEGFAETTLQVSPDGPLPNLLAARDEIRKQRVTQPDETFRVVVAAGRYEISRPLEFGVEDGNVTYEAATDASPVISGGRKIETQWTDQGDGVWTSQLPKDWQFEQLWINDHRAVRAREPDDFFYYLTGSKESPIEGGKRFQQVLSAEPEDIASLRGLSPDQLSQVQILAFHKWDTTRRFLDAVDLDQGQLKITGRAMKSWNKLTRNTGFLLENYLEALDEPGEFFLAPSGRLHYRPRSGETIDAINCVSPVCEKLVVIQGDSAEGNYVENLEFHGLKFHHSGIQTPSRGFDPAQAASPIEAAIQIDGGKGVAFENCEIGHTGGYGIWFRKGCRDSSLKHCWVHDLGAGGVRIGETSIASNPSERTSNIIVDNNIVNDAGHMFACAVGIWVGNSGHNQVTHNEVADMFYTGISVGWRWGYDESLANNNLIADNHIHHLGKGWLSDMGGIYTLGPSPGTVLRGNRIHDVDSWGYGGWGLYNDEGSTDILMENNLVYRTKSGGYHQHYGRNNVIRNNIFAFGREYQIRRTRVEDHLSFTYEQNIVVWDGEHLFNGKWGDDGVEIARNQYWRMGEPVDLSPADTSTESIIKDPHFVAPYQDDFRLTDPAAVSQIGFQPFDTTQAGVYGDTAWIEHAQSLPMPKMLRAPEPLPQK